MIQEGQIWANDMQKFKVMGFEPSGLALIFGITKIDYLNVDENGKREIPVDILEEFLTKEMSDFKLVS
ncbi:MAG TPA: hypothetical protein VIM89_18570 [Mucilaginibacter sp.]